MNRSNFNELVRLFDRLYDLQQFFNGNVKALINNASSADRVLYERHRQAFSDINLTLIRLLTGVPSDLVAAEDGYRRMLRSGDQLVDHILVMGQEALESEPKFGNLGIDEADLRNLVFDYMGRMIGSHLAAGENVPELVAGAIDRLKAKITPAFFLMSLQRMRDGGLLTAIIKWIREEMRLGVSEAMLWSKILELYTSFPQKIEEREARSGAKRRAYNRMAAGTMKE